MDVFVNAEQKRLRAGWRLLIQFIAFIAVLTLSALASAFVPNPAAQTLVGAATYLAAGLGLAWLMARFIDRRPFAAFGFHFSAGWWIDFVFGLALGAALLSGIFFSLQGAGWIRVTHVSATDLGVPIAAALVIKLASYVAVGINEELMFRGYQVRNLAEGLSKLGARAAVVLAAVLSSSLFGIVHFVNELSGGADTNPVATMNLILAGLMLAIPFLLTGELALPIGLHITWNLFEGNVYGFAVSGLGDGTSLITTAPTGPELWTGGAYGPEGGLVGTVFVLIGCVASVVWVWVRTKRVEIDASIARYEARV